MKPSLKLVDIYYGSKCQLACAQCDTRSDLIRKGEFDPDIETIKQGILLVKDKFNIEVLSVLGGEPLLYLEKVEEIIKFIRSVDQKTVVMLPTNGELISKNMDYLVKIIKEYDVLLMVADHLNMFSDKKRSMKIEYSINELSTRLNLPPANTEIMWSVILDERAFDESWIEYQKTALDYRGDDPNDTHETAEDFWWNGKYGIYYHKQNSHLKHYFLKDGKPKPFNSSNINDSYYKSCPSCYCTFMNDKKLYKCAALGTLKQFLERHQSLEDVDWQKYLNYKFLDLENCTDEEVLNFSNSKFKPILECSMCPENPIPVILDESTSSPIKIYKNYGKNKNISH